MTVFVSLDNIVCIKYNTAQLLKPIEGQFIRDYSSIFEKYMSHYKFTTIWILLFAILFTGLSSFGIAPKNIFTMNKRILSSLTFAQNVNADEALPRGAETNLIASVEGKNIVVSGGIEPEKIIIEKIGVSSPIVNPKTTDSRTLDAELKMGVVHYPGSGYLNENSNLFLFGHSTSLTNVRNKAYEAFNDLGKLNIGDVIKIYAKGEMYEYSVVSMSLAKADEALVTFSNDKKMLTLSTCNTFGKKEDRFVVTAVFVGHSILVDK